MRKESDRDPRPIIVTAGFDGTSHDFFQRRRDQFFPPQLNLVPAHLTLFHTLPGEREGEVLEAIAATIAGRAPFEVTVSAPMLLGRGVAYRIVSEELVALRAAMAARLSDMPAMRLSGQDRQGFRPHVTVQNKVSPGEAKGTCAILTRDFAPFTARIEGIQLWHYDGGPWQPMGALLLDG